MEQDRCEEELWKSLCVKKWKPLATDEHAGALVSRDVALGSPTCWRQLYPLIQPMSQWTCRLQFTTKFICNIIAHKISGDDKDGVFGGRLAEALCVARRSPLDQLGPNWLMPESPFLYFEPAMEEDRVAFSDFIEYLTVRIRAGLVCENDRLDPRRILLFPSCDFSREEMGYCGQSLLGFEMDMNKRRYQANTLRIAQNAQNGQNEQNAP